MVVTIQLTQEEMNAVQFVTGLLDRLEQQGEPVTRNLARRTSRSLSETLDSLLPNDAEDAPF